MELTSFIFLTGPEVATQSKEVPKKIVMMLHGYGSNGKDLIDLSGYFNMILPDAYFVSPNAPFAFENIGYNSYQWFSLLQYEDEYMYEGITKAAIILNNYIDEQLARFSLTDEDLILLGFSQGAMMSLHVALRREKKIAGVVAFSGALIGAKHLAGEIKSKPNILLVHGDEDTVVPVKSLELAKKVLTKEQVPVSSLICKNLGHSINIEGIDAAANFMKSL